MKKLFICLMILILASKFICAQVCGTAGLDGSGNISSSINTYYPVVDDFTLEAGQNQILLKSVPATDAYENDFGKIPISAGDLLLIIQIQNATINYENSPLYGSDQANSAPDFLGGTGFSSNNNTGVFEYAVATNDVSLSGGKLVFKAAGLNGGCIFSYVNSPATATQGKKTFQIIRVPQYSNLILSTNISTPPFNGEAGGIIAFDVAGSMDFNGKLIDASAKGFRGGYGLKAPSGKNDNNLYVTPSNSTLSAGKGEGIGGTPKYMWDGYNEVTNLNEGLPNGSSGKGAPANGGGAGNDHNAGGGGGGNGGFGGVGGNGASYGGVGSAAYPNGGRPGSTTFTDHPDISKLIMGGGGGGGDANDALTGVKGGVGGGLVLINAGKIIGSGSIRANGGNGEAGVAGISPDGAGGGGAGGSVLIKITDPDPSITLNIEAIGGNGGNTINDGATGNEHGPGGGGGGGIIMYSINSGTINASINGGNSGFTNSGVGSSHFAAAGQNGIKIPYNLSELPYYLLGGGKACYPSLTTTISVDNPGAEVFIGDEIVYEIRTSNASGGGNAGKVDLNMHFSQNLSYKSAAIRLTGNASLSGLEVINTSKTTDTKVSIGSFNISPQDTVIIRLTMTVGCNETAGEKNASAEAVYFDPTRTSINPARKITAKINASLAYPFVYESNPIEVPGSNYNGFLTSSNQEDVLIKALPQITNNTINLIKKSLIICATGSIGLIEGSVPIGGNNSYTFQWESSRNGTNFIQIPNANAKDYTSPVIDTTMFYRRVVYSSCELKNISETIKILVAPKPVVSFDVPNFCLNDGIAIFTNTSTIADNSEGDFSYSWDFGDPYANALHPNISNQKDGKHVYTKSQIYEVKLTVTSNNGCEVTLTKIFSVNGSNPSPNFNISGGCADQPVVFEDKAEQLIGEITKIEWYFDADNKPNDPNYILVDEHPNLRSDTAKKYLFKYPNFNNILSKQVKVKMKVFSGQSCFNEISKYIALNASPEIKFDSIPDVCINDVPFYISQANEINKISGKGFFIGNGVSSDGFFNPSIVGVGTHTITYTFLATNNCTTLKTRDVIVKPSPIATAGTTIKILVGGQAILPAQVTGDNLKFKWTPEEGLDNSNILNPIASPLNDTKYTLLATSENSCSVQVDMNVEVIKFPVIPNTFTPNGDGINDIWEIKNLDSYPQSTVKIFNRYGSVVSLKSGINYSWDGKLNGNDLPVGTYYYIIDPKLGLNLITGSVTVIR